jgi:hypothetical protein
MPSLSTLLSTGSLDTISIGNSREMVRLAIGECEGDYEYQGTIVEKRGVTQFTYRGDKLLSVAWNLAESDKPFFGQVDYDRICKTTTPYEFFDYCDAVGISWSIEPALTFDRQLCVRTGEQVVVLFDLDPREIQKVVIGSIS